MLFASLSASWLQVHSVVVFWGLFSSIVRWVCMPHPRVWLSYRPWSWKFFAMFFFLTLVLAFASKEFSLVSERPEWKSTFKSIHVTKQNGFVDLFTESLFFRGVCMTSSSSLPNVDNFVTHHNRLARRLWFRQTGTYFFSFLFFVFWQWDPTNLKTDPTVSFLLLFAWSSLWYNHNGWLGVKYQVYFLHDRLVA